VGRGGPQHRELSHAARHHHDRTAIGDARREHRRDLERAEQVERERALGDVRVKAAHRDHGVVDERV
jgi:hypothetical protein